MNLLDSINFLDQILRFLNFHHTTKKKINFLIYAKINKIKHIKITLIIASDNLFNFSGKSVT